MDLLDSETSEKGEVSNKNRVKVYLLRDSKVTQTLDCTCAHPDEANNVRHERKVSI